MLPMAVLANTGETFDIKTSRRCLVEIMHKLCLTNYFAFKEFCPFRTLFNSHSFLNADFLHFFTYIYVIKTVIGEKNNVLY